MAQVFFSLLGLLSLSFLLAASIELPTCRTDATCVNEWSSLSLDVDGNQGGYTYFHFVLQDLSVINGSAFLLINPLAVPDIADTVPGSTPFPYPQQGSNVWNATKANAPNVLRVRLQFMQYFIAVFTPPTVNASTFQLQLQLVDSATGLAIDPTRREPGIAQAEAALVQPKSIEYDVLILPSEPIGMDVWFNTSTDSVSAYEYQVLYQASAATSAGDMAAAAADTPCATLADVLDDKGALLPGLQPVYADAGRCVFDTPCGALSNMVSGSAWVQFPSNTLTHLRVEGLTQQMGYTFNVVVRNPATGAVAVYGANRGTPAYEKTSTMAGNDVTAIVAGSAAGGFLLLVLAAFALKCHIDTRVKRAGAKYQVIVDHAAGEIRKRRLSTRSINGQRNSTGFDNPMALLTESPNERPRGPYASSLNTHWSGVHSAALSPTGGTLTPTTVASPLSDGGFAMGQISTTGTTGVRRRHFKLSASVGALAERQRPTVHVAPTIAERPSEDSVPQQGQATLHVSEMSSFGALSPQKQDGLAPGRLSDPQRTPVLSPAVVSRDSPGSARFTASSPRKGAVGFIPMTATTTTFGTALSVKTVPASPMRRRSVVGTTPTLTNPMPYTNSPGPSMGTARRDSGTGSARRDSGMGAPAFSLGVSAPPPVTTARGSSGSANGGQPLSSRYRAGPTITTPIGDPRMPSPGHTLTLSGSLRRTPAHPAAAMPEIVSPSDDDMQEYSFTN